MLFLRYERKNNGNRMADKVLNPVLEDAIKAHFREKAAKGGRAGTGAKKARTREQCQKAVRERERRKQEAVDARNVEQIRKLRERLRQ